MKSPLVQRWLPVFLLLVSLFSPACQFANLTYGVNQIPDKAGEAAADLRVNPPSSRTLSATEMAPKAPPEEYSAGVAPSSNNGFVVRYHPEGGLYIGDLVSFEVLSPPDFQAEKQQVQVWLGDHQLGSALFGRFGIAGRSQATLLWVWDTQELSPGAYHLQFVIAPDGYRWTEEIILQPLASVPPPEPAVRWLSAETACCLVHYVSGTAAARDLELLLDAVEAQSEFASKKMGVELEQTIEVVLLPRVLGHGGFASDEIAISYLDRNYASNDLAQVLRHELLHILDGRLGGGYRPSLFVEGLAVYFSGGHYRQEPLLRRAAALPALGLYLPLTDLADNFYESQHEVGYLQGGALVQFMVEEWGEAAFFRFYRRLPPPGDLSPSQAIDRGLKKSFGISLGQLEMRFLAELRRQALIPDLLEDVRLTVDLYDTVRRYQQALDPSAYFLTAWLLNGQEMRQRQIVADYLRHPSTEENRRLETKLVQAGEYWRQGRYPEAFRLLAEVNRRLSIFERQETSPVVTVPETSQFYSPTHR
jgi:hypothetical protein